MQENAKKITLIEAQEIAITALVAGKRVTAAAREAGVNSRTVSDWLESDADFKAALDHAQEEMCKCLGPRSFATVEKAFVNLEKAIEDGDNKVALRLLRDLKILGVRTPNFGGNDPALVEGTQNTGQSMEVVERIVFRREDDPSLAAGQSSRGTHLPIADVGEIPAASAYQANHLGPSH